MTILALDATTSIFTAAIQTNDGFVETTIDFGTKHSEKLLPIINNLMEMSGIEASQIDAFALASGPGSFTGLRISLATIKGMAFAYNKSVIMVPSLDIYAHAHSHFPGLIVPIIDARKGRIYTALYNKGTRISDYLDVTFTTLETQTTLWDRVHFVGPDAELAGYTEKPNQTIDCAGRRSYAKELLALSAKFSENNIIAQSTDGPLYLRHNDEDLGITLKKAIKT